MQLVNDYEYLIGNTCHPMQLDGLNIIELICDMLFWDEGNMYYHESMNVNFD